MMCKAMFIKKGGKAIHKLGDLSRKVNNVELIYVYGETETAWIGRYAEGYGFINVYFSKSDCRPATSSEVEICKQGRMREIIF